MPYNETEVITLIELLENESIPIVGNIVHRLLEMLGTAELHRRNCLIAKTTGVSVGAVGTGFAILGVVLTPVAGPIALLVLPVVGLTMNVLGAATSSGTYITERILEKKSQGELDTLFEKFASTKKEWEDLLDKNEDLKSQLYKLIPDYCDEEVDTKTMTSEKVNGEKNNVNYMLQWLKSHIFAEEEIQIEDIKEGDHIYRPLGKKFNVYTIYHHGVYLGNNEIADFGSAGKKGATDETPVIRPLSEFFEGNPPGPIYRRNYKGFQVPISRTIDLAKKIVLEKISWNPYSLFENNCEHFATFLKLEKSWSEQASSFFVTGVAALEQLSKIPKSVQIGVDAVEFLAKATAGSAGAPLTLAARLKSAFSFAPKTTAITTVSKAAVIIGPIMTAVDIASLIYDFNKTQPNIEAIQKALELMLKDLVYYKIYLGHLKDSQKGNQKENELYPQLE